MVLGATFLSAVELFGIFMLTPIPMPADNCQLSDPCSMGGDALGLLVFWELPALVVSLVVQLVALTWLSRWPRYRTLHWLLQGALPAIPTFANLVFVNTILLTAA